MTIHSLPEALEAARQIKAYLELSREQRKCLGSCTCHLCQAQVDFSGGEWLLARARGNIETLQPTSIKE